jgi:hypothetical protein
MVEAGRGLPGNSHVKPKVEMTDATAPPVFAALYSWSLLWSLFVSSF